MSATPQASFSRKDHLYLRLLHLLARCPLTWLQILGRCLGFLASLGGSTPVFVARRNIELCFPEREAAWVNATARQCLQKMAMSYLEFAKIWGSPPSYAVGQIRQVHGEEIFRRAISGHSGTIALLPHFGCWEVMNAWTNQYVHTTIMYKPAKDAGVDSFVRAARSRLDAHLVATDDSGVRALLKALKKNGFVAILPDHVPDPQGGEYADFFAIDTLSTVLASKLWQRTRAAVIVMYAVRNAAGQGFDLHFEEAAADFFSDDLPTSVRGMNASVEHLIRSSPADYHWAYKRFKTCRGLDRVYDRRHPPLFAAQHPAARRYQHDDA